MQWTPYRTGQCEWIEPYPLTSMERCQHDHAEGLPYCSEHQARTRQTGTALRRRHKDIERAAVQQDIGSLFNDVVAELEAEGELEL